MGRSKFPGKPSKSVFKERVCVLYNQRNKQYTNIASANLNEKNCNNVLGTDERCFPNTSTQPGQHRSSESVECAEADFRKQTNSPLLYNECKESSSVGNSEHDLTKSGIYVDTCATTTGSSKSRISDLQNTKICLTEIERFIKKKTVTFKKSLETSDDGSGLNRVHNPQNKGPLISIMKKECPTSNGCFTRGDGIVRPSRLTEIIKNNENIDKTIALTFRSSPIPETKHLNNTKLKKSGLSVRKCKSGSFFLGLPSNENFEQLAPESNNRNYCQLLEDWTLRTLCSKNDNFSSPDAHSVCIICSTTVSSKNQENLEYGVMTCDVCRQFTSNLTIQNVSSSTNAIIPLKLQCWRGDGDCLISALPKNNVKSYGHVYNERCSSCWLKKCVRAFQLPYGHEFRFNPKLFETLRNKIDGKYFNEQYGSLSNRSTQRNNKTCLNWRLLKPSDELVDSLKSHQNVFSSISDISKLSDGLTFARCSNPIKNKEPKSLKKTVKLQPNTNNAVREYAKRQINYFKGPRVKHVCRSASIALGQQIATFSNDCGNISKLLQTKSQIGDSSFPKSLIENICFLTNQRQTFSQKVGKVINESLIELEVGQDIWKKCVKLSAVESSKNQLTRSSASDKGNKMHSFEANKSLAFDKILIPKRKNGEPNKSYKKHSKKHDMLMLGHRHIKEKSLSISIDFWNTSVSAEVNETGFGLILTDPVSILALCFLCGSMDLDNLLFCASCCEPYHNYCVNEENIRINKVLRDINCTNKYLLNNEVINQLNWICPRCTICSTCNMSSGAKLKCQKCKKHYHSTCLGTSKALLGADRPLICKNCLKCQSCLNTKVSKYVGSQPICIQCFQLRKTESRCLVCNRFFCNILDPIILECSYCHQLVHSKCEGLTEEQSNLLSNISTEKQFVCKKCAQSSEEAKKLANGWRASVNEELSIKLLDILKLLSRSRQASVLKKRAETACVCRFEEIGKTCEISHCKRGKPNTFTGLSENNDLTLNDIMERTTNLKCFCHNDSYKKPSVTNNLNILDIKKKIINGKYISLFDFDQDMNEVIAPLKNDELILTYKEILCEKFSWFQNETKTCTDALEEDMFESYNYQFPLDDIPCEDSNIKSSFPEFVGKMINSLKLEKDNRVCALCLKEGDCNDQEESRLLYYCNNIWVHVNCAMWSCDVYEEFDGSLQNINIALHRGRLTKCFFCKWLGATIKCLEKTCCNYYHFQCARKAKCVFESNRSVYCSIHYDEKVENKIISNFSFNILRPLYIESDKLRKYVEPSKVRFMMGSLSVLQLGTVFSKFCDTSEVTVPLNFCCTRLYWSCREPWRLVKYKVRTFIQKSTKVLTNDLEKNFTVDHSKNISLVEKELLRIAIWHAKISRESKDDMTKGQIVDQSTNLRYSKTGDINGGLTSDMCIDEEPQNSSDLLPPEIKDAIFEDLPHDILDGISMLDIFPKLMIYEDLINIENKSDSLIVTETTEKCVLKRSDHRAKLVSKQELNNVVFNNAEDSNFSIPNVILPGHDLKRSSSEILFRNVHKIKSQRRCSSITCKCNEEYYLNPSPGLCQNEMKCSYFKRNKIEHRYDANNSNSKDDKILVEMRRDNFKFIQLDGTDDSFMGYSNTTVENSTSKSPVKCDRCHCTYRTFCSFQRHLVNCEQISTSESETDTISRPSDLLHATVLLKTDTTENNLQAYSNQIGNNELYTSHMSNVEEPSILLSDHINSKNGISVTSGCGDAFDFHTEESLNNAHRTNNYNNNCFNGSCENTLSKTFGQCSNKYSNRSKCLNNSKTLYMKEKDKQINVRLKSKPEAPIGPVKGEALQVKKEHNFNCGQYLQNQQFVVTGHNTVNSAPLYFQPVHNQATVQQQFLPLILSNNSIQFTSMPSSQNSLLQGSVMQTDISGNAMLSGLQLLSLPSLQLTASQPLHPVATLNQQQLGPNHVLIGNTPLTELVPNTNQMVLSAPPLYYGLETIVQNTFMSSQQFISTAMQGVLGQNASFSATTTQVFQSSTIEPVSDAGNAYILLNNSDGSAVLMPQTNMFVNGNDVQNFYTNYENVCVSFPHTFIQEPQLNNGLPVLPSLPDESICHIQTTLNAERKIQIPSPEKLNYKNTSTSNHVSNENIMQSDVQNCKIKTVLVESNNPCDDSYMQIVCEGSNNSGTEYKSAVENKFNSKDSVRKQLEPTRKSVKRCKVPKKSQADYVFMNIENSDQCKKPFLNHTITPHNRNQSGKVQSLPLLDTNHSSKNNYPQSNSKLERPEYNKILNDSESNKTKLSNINSFSTQTSNSSELLYTSLPPGNGLNNFNNIHLSPTLQPNQNMNTPTRPTNRVLPMQSIHRSIDKSKSKKKVNVIESFETLASNLDTEKNTFPINQRVKSKNSEISDKNENDLGINSELFCSKTNNELVKTQIDCSYGDSEVKKSLKLQTSDTNIHKPDRVVPPDCFNNCNQFVYKRCDHMELLNENVKDKEKQTTSDSVGICTQNKYESVEQNAADRVSHVINSLPFKIQRQNKNVPKNCEPLLMYEMQSEDGFYLKSKSISQIWENLFDSVQVARRAHGLLSLPKGPFADMCGVQMIGLKTKTLKFLIEQLPVTEACKYTQKYYKHPFSCSDDYFYNDGEELFENSFGASRCEPFQKRSEYDLFSWLASRHRKQPKQVVVHHSDNDLISRRCTANLPMAMKYRTLKETCKHKIGVFRSAIHGRGLFCTEDIEAGEMVIEYAGELIRSTLTDKRERCYDSRGIGCYMFKIDDNFVVDATMRGNAARFINHSCEPNCYSKVVDILGHKHIIIFSLRRIVQGEELTYDYKFPFEDIKIPCSCGSKKCRKYLN